MLPELLVEAEEVGFNDHADGWAGTNVFGGFEDGGGVENEVVDALSGRGKARIEVVEAAEYVVVDFIVRRVLETGAVHGLRKVGWLFGGAVLHKVSTKLKDHKNLYFICQDGR